MPSRTIRVDQEVYEWLQSKATPFKDTPNTTLLRIMLKEKMKKEKGRKLAYLGERLKELEHDN